MYAIIEDGGKQYRVEKDETIYIERRDIPEGTSTIDLGPVLVLGDGSNSKIGTPWVDGAKVTATVQGEIKGPKLEIVKYRRRKGYHLHKGHRQNYLKVTVASITG